jgi:hypothetical protein
MSLRSPNKQGVIMSIQRTLALGACVAIGAWQGCASDAAPDQERAVGAATQALELSCVDVTPDAAATWSSPQDVEIVSLSTADPNHDENYNGANQQTYGSSSCSGYVAEFDNPNHWSPGVAFVQGGGWVDDDVTDRVFGSDERCSGFTLEADIWGYVSGLWIPIGGAVIPGQYHPKGDYLAQCDLTYQIQDPGYYEKYRMIGRVSSNDTTYAFRGALQ